jgi:DNA polymerase-3 subunit delta'
VPWSRFAGPRALRALAAAAADPAHAYLIAGPDGSARDILATELAQALLCEENSDSRPCEACSACRRVAGGNHPDLIVLSPQGKLGYREEETAEIPAQAAVAPFEGRHKVFLIKRADRMNRWGANALLKVLEEPPARVVLILLTAAPDQLLETVRSRCRLIEVQPPSRQAIVEATRDAGLTAEAAERLSRLAAGDLVWALEAAGDSRLADERQERISTLFRLMAAPIHERFRWARAAADRFNDDHDLAYAELDLLAAIWRDVLHRLADRGEPTVTAGEEEAVSELASELSPVEVTAALNAIIATKEALEANVNARLALESLMLALPRKGVAAKGEDAELSPRGARV